MKRLDIDIQVLLKYLNGILSVVAARARYVIRRRHVG
jgi:hypothetical protein